MSPNRPDVDGGAAEPAADGYGCCRAIGDLNYSDIGFGPHQ